MRGIALHGFKTGTRNIKRAARPPFGCLSIHGVFSISAKYRGRLSGGLLPINHSGLLMACVFQFCLLNSEINIGVRIGFQPLHFQIQLTLPHYHRGELHQRAIRYRGYSSRYPNLSRRCWSRVISRQRFGHPHHYRLPPRPAMQQSNRLQRIPVLLSPMPHTRPSQTCSDAATCRLSNVIGLFHIRIPSNL